MYFIQISVFKYLCFFQAGQCFNHSWLVISGLFELFKFYVNLGTVHYSSGSPGREKYDRVLNFVHLSLTGFEFFLPLNDGC